MKKPAYLDISKTTMFSAPNPISSTKPKNETFEDFLDDDDISVVSQEYDCLNYLANTEPIKQRLNNPILMLTSKILSTYKAANPNYRFFEEMKPRRELTEPNEGVTNEGRDNINNDLIVWVGDTITNGNNEYIVMDLLGKFNIKFSRKRS